jgi:ankyrin repeat protein
MYDPLPEGVDAGPRGAATAAHLTSLLCDAGADVNARDGMGFTALHLASAHGEDECVAELLNRGAFMDVQDYEVRGLVESSIHGFASNGLLVALVWPACSH